MLGMHLNPWCASRNYNVYIDFFLSLILHYICIIDYAINSSVLFENNVLNKKLDFEAKYAANFESTYM